MFAEIVGNDDLYYLEISDVFNLSIVSKKMRLCQVTFLDHHAWKSFYKSSVKRIIELTNSYTDYLQVSSNYRQSFLSLLKQINDQVERHPQKLTEDILKLPTPSSMNTYPFVAAEEFMVSSSSIPYDLQSLAKKHGPISVVVLGPEHCGKTSFLISLCTENYPDDTPAAIFDVVNERVDYKDIHANICWR